MVLEGVFCDNFFFGQKYFFDFDLKETLGGSGRLHNYFVGWQWGSTQHNVASSPDMFQFSPSILRIRHLWLEIIKIFVFYQQFSTRHNLSDITDINTIYLLNRRLNFEYFIS